jgi:mannosyltransferase
MSNASQTADQAATSPSGRQSAWVFGTVGVLATAILALIRLSAKPLWHDEAFSEAVAQLDLPTMWRAIIQGEAFNGLYYLILHPWVRVADGEAWLRLPSVMFGVLAVFALFLLNRRLFNVPIATISCLLLAVNPFFVQYEQEARPYAMAVLAAVLATHLFVRAVEGDSLWRWLAYGGVGALAIYVHLFAGLVVAAHLGSLLLRRPRPRAMDIVAGYGLTGLLVAPLLVRLLSGGHLRRPFIAQPTLGSFDDLFRSLIGADGASLWEGRLLLLTYFLACVGGLLAGMSTIRIRRGSGSDEGLWRWGVVLSWLAVPVVGSFAISVSWTPLFLPRYLIVALPPLATIAAAGIAALPRSWLRAAGLALLVGLSFRPLLTYYAAHSKNGEDWRGTVAYIAREERAADGVVFLSRYGRRPFEYYRQRLGATLAIPVYPAVEWGAYTPVLADADIESTELAAIRLGLVYPRIWVVLLWEGFHSVHEDVGPLKAALDRGYRAVDERGFGWALRVRLYVRDSAGTD